MIDQKTLLAHGHAAEAAVLGHLKRAKVSAQAVNALRSEDWIAAGFPADGGYDIEIRTTGQRWDVKRKYAGRNEVFKTFRDPKSFPRHKLDLGRKDMCDWQIENLYRLGGWIWMCEDCSGGLAVPVELVLDGAVEVVKGKAGDFLGRDCYTVDVNLCEPFDHFVERMRRTELRAIKLMQLKQERAQRLLFEKEQTL